MHWQINKGNNLHLNTGQNSYRRIKPVQTIINNTSSDLNKFIILLKLYNFVKKLPFYTHAIH